VIGASSSGSGFFLILILGFVLLWLIVVRPQRRRQSQQRQMLQDLHVGDDVLTAGGIYGKVARLEENEVSVEIAPQLEVRVARRAIAAVLTEAEPESAEPEGSGEPEQAGGQDEAERAEEHEMEPSAEVEPAGETSAEEAPG
jgi:preprotein translocase subunit YajC